ncbi:NAD-dependent epimerase/dehydratase family protein, partial [Devosia sp.]|uniref:NAD-dependent epimerase/dehydratase family protein n=1 Tax=Devosia sp. TaxID=1871048 RepID=UPI002AFE9E21
MRILITGGGGFIGSALSRALLARGHEVVILDPLSPQIHGDLPTYEPVPGTVLRRRDVRSLRHSPELLDGVEVVFHLAAETGTGQSMYRIADYVDVNEMGTAALLEAIAQAPSRPRRLILASSRSIYGEGAYVAPSRPDRLIQPAARSQAQLQKGQWDFTDETGETLEPVPTPEHLPPRPASVYAATKMAQEMLVSSACPGLGVTASILRFQNVYGEGQSLQNPYTGVLSILFNRARQGLEINVYEDGKESRDFVHISDIVAALLLVMEADTPSGAVYNVGSGVPTSLLELAQTLTGLAGFSAPIRVSGDFRVGDIRHCYADLTAIRRDLGFEPAVS